MPVMRYLEDLNRSRSVNWNQVRLDRSASVFAIVNIVVAPWFGRARPIRVGTGHVPAGTPSAADRRVGATLALTPEPAER